jgi:4-hydroxy-tetrahydrodipicolinate reductase
MVPVPDKPRLVLYGIGQYGQMMVRFADKKGWPIVAAYNRAGAKVGQDIGRLAGLDRDYGVTVADCDTADYTGLDADLGIITMYDELAVNFPAYERLLGAGLNVICHGSESYYPHAVNAELAGKIDALARDNSVTWTGTGVWDMSRIWAALTAAGVCDEIQSLHNHSLTILDPFGEKIMLMAGVGMTPEEFHEKIAGPGSSFGGQFYRLGPQLVLNALGFAITDSSYRQEPFVLDQPHHSEALGREIPAGRCAGMSVVVEAHSAEGVTATARMESRIRLSPDEVEHSSWHITGNVLSPSIRIERDNGHYMQALSVFNRVKDVIAAPPGIQLMTQLPGPMRPLITQ